MTPNPKPSPELLPCPFCGGEAVITIDRGRDTVGIECRKCTANMTPSWSMASEVWARRSWNTRVSQTLPAPGEVANLRARLVAAEHAARKWEQACEQSWDREALATVAAANDEGVAEQAAQFADGVAEGAQSLYDLAARDRDTVGTLIHGEAVRVAKHIAAAIRLLPQGGGKA